jgi:DNA (cytosine-5)-methyltransferase 1
MTTYTYDQERVVQGIRGIIEESLDGAIETSLDPPPKCIFKVQKELEITGTPHSYLLLKHPQLISFGKRISPHHSEILDLNAPCKTIICAYTFQPRLYVCIQTPTKKYVRCLTNNELAQIQSFPKDYPFKGSDSSIKKQIGNAVPSKIVEQLVKSILENQEQV